MNQAANLEYLDEMWEEAEEPEISDKPPIGKYHAKVDEVEFRQSQSGSDLLNWKLVAVDGEHEGRILFRNNMLTTTQNLGYCKHDLRLCGIDISAENFKLSDFINNRLAELLDKVVLVNVKVQKDDADRYNVYFVEKPLFGDEDEMQVARSKSKTGKAGKESPASDDSAAGDPWAEE
jgi:hypothetical protein